MKRGERECERDRKIPVTHWFMHQKLQQPWIGQGKARNPQLRLDLPYACQELQHLEPSSAVPQDRD